MDADSLFTRLAGAGRTEKTTRENVTKSNVNGVTNETNCSRITKRSPTMILQLQSYNAKLCEEGGE